MHVRKGSAARRRRPIVAVLVLALLVAALAFVSTGLRQHRQEAARRAPVLIGKGGGFGEVYEAKATTLKKTLFNATLLPKNPTVAQHRAGRPRPRRQEGQLRPGAQVLEEQRLQHRYGRQAHRRLHRAVRRERLPPDVEDGVHPPGADVPAGRQDHLQERPLGPEPGHRRLQGGDRTEGQPDRHAIRTSATRCCR